MFGSKLLVSKLKKILTLAYSLMDKNTQNSFLKGHKAYIIVIYVHASLLTGNEKKAGIQ